MDEELKLAQQAIANGKDPAAVAARFKQRTGQDFPGGEPPAPGWADRDQTNTAEKPWEWDPRDAMRLTADQRSEDAAKRNLQIGLTAGSVAIPGMGKAANIAVNAGTGAVIGALGAEPGDRMRAAKTGAILAGIGGTVSEAGAGLISKLTAPGRILNLRNVVPELRDLISAEGRTLAEGSKRAVSEATALTGERTRNAGKVFDTRQQSVEEMVDAMAAGRTETARRAADGQTNTAGPRVAGRIRETTGITDPIDVANARTRQAMGDVSEQYQNLDQAIEHDGLIALMSSPEFRRDAAAVGYEGGAPTLSQFQDFRNRFRGPGNNQDRQLYSRINRMGQQAIEGLPDTDRAYAQLSGTLRERRLGQKAGAQPASTLREHVAGLAERPEQVVAFREGRAADLLQRLEQKDTGAPALQSLLDGGPEMDARLAAVFPDHVADIKNIIAEERAAMTETLRSRDAAVASLGNQRKSLTDLLGRDRVDAIKGIESEGTGAIQDILERTTTGQSRLNKLDSRAQRLEADRVAMQKAAENTARRIRRLVGAAGAAAVGGTTWGLMRAGAP